MPSRGKTLVCSLLAFVARLTGRPLLHFNSPAVLQSATVAVYHLQQRPFPGCCIHCLAAALPVLLGWVQAVSDLRWKVLQALVELSQGQALEELAIPHAPDGSCRIAPNSSRSSTERAMRNLFKSFTRYVTALSRTRQQPSLPGGGPSPLNFEWKSLMSSCGLGTSFTLRESSQLVLTPLSTLGHITHTVRQAWLEVRVLRDPNKQATSVSSRSMFISHYAGPRDRFTHLLMVVIYQPSDMRIQSWNRIAFSHGGTCPGVSCSRCHEGLRALSRRNARLTHRTCTVSGPGGCQHTPPTTRSTVTR